MGLKWLKIINLANMSVKIKLFKKTSLLACASALFFFISAPGAEALVEVDNVAAGSAEFTNIDANTLQVTATDKAIINYKSFNILENETVNFILPSKESTILNNVIGSSSSSILGRLFCNGILFLVNPNGITFGPNSSVEAAGFIASTRAITNDNFLNSNYIFEKLAGKDGLLLNQGQIRVTDAGFGVFIAGAIENEGSIIASVGKIALASGDAVSVDFAGNSLISVVIDEPVAETILDEDGNPITEQIKNTGTIEANGGEVLIKAQALPGIFEKAINVEGVVRAVRIDNIGGKVVLVTERDIVMDAAIFAAQIQVGLEGESVPENVLIKENSTIEAEQSVTVLAKNDIEVRSGITTQNGNIDILADYDNDKQGSFTQAPDTTIEAKGAGDVYIDSSETMTLYNVKTEEGAIKIGTRRTPDVIAGAPNYIHAEGDLVINQKESLSGQTAALSTTRADQLLYNPAGELGLEASSGKVEDLTLTSIQADTLKITANAVFVNSAAPSTEVYKNAGDIFIQDAQYSHIDNTAILEGEDLKLTYVNNGDLTLVTDNRMHANPAIIISANNLKLIAKEFGSSVSPLALSAANLHIQRLSNSINILESLGIGTSIMLRGPPEDNFSIIYNHDTNLILEACKVSTVGSQPLNLFGNISFHNFECLIPGKTLYFENNKLYKFFGNTSIIGIPGHAGLIKLLSSQEGSPAYTVFEGDTHISYVAIRDLYNTGVVVKTKPSTNWGNISGFDTDPTWDGGGSTSAWSEDANWDTDTEPTAFDTCTFDGTSSDDSEVDALFAGTITSLVINGYAGNLTLGRSLAITGSLNIIAGTLDLNGQNLDLTGATFSNTGTLRLQGDETLTAFTNDTDSGTVEYDGADNYYDLVAGNDYYNLVFNNAAASWSPDADVDVNNALTINGGAFCVSNYDLDMTGATFTNNDTLYISGTTTLTNFTNDTDSGCVSYAYAGTGLVAGNTYYDLLIGGDAGDIRELSADVVVNHRLSIYTATLDLNGHNLDLNGGEFNNQGVLRLHGDETLTNFTNDTDSGTVEYDGGDTYINPLPAGDDYYNLTFNNAAGYWSLEANLDVNNNLTINAGQLELAGYDLDMTGATFVNNGTLKLYGSETLTNFVNDTDSGDVFYWNPDLGTYNLVAGNAYYSLTLSNGGTYSLNADLDVNDGIALYDFTTLDLNGHNLDMTGADPFWNENGTLRLQGNETLTNFTNDTDTGTIYFYGAVNGTIPTGGTYWDVVFDNAVGSWSLSTDTTINNLLSILDGTVSSGGNDLIMGGGATFDNHGTLVFAGTETLTNFTNDTDSGAICYYNAGTVNGLIAGNTYYGLAFTNGGTFNLGADVDVNGFLWIQNGGGAATFDLNGHNLDMTGASFDNTGTLRLEGGETLTAFTNDTDSGTVEYDGTGAYYELVAGDSYYNLTFNNAASLWCADAAVDVNNMLTITAGEFALDGQDLDLTGATFSNTGTLGLIGTETLTNFTNDTDSGTVGYSGTGVGLNGGNTYWNLLIGGGAGDARDLAADVVVNNGLSIYTATFDLNGHNLNMVGGAPLNNQGVLRLQGSETLTNFTNDTDSGTVEYDGAGVHPGLAAGDNYYNLTFDNAAGSWNLVANVDINGALNIVAGGLDLNHFDLDITGGSFSNTGTLWLRGEETLTGFTNDTDSGTVAYNGAGGFSGLAAGDAYYNLTFSNGVGTWDLDADLDVNNSLILEATLDLNGFNLDLTGATFTNNDTLRLQGGETLTNFTNDTNSGTVEYDGNGSYWVLAAGGNYYNVIFNNAASDWNTDVDIDVNNALTINAGALDLGGHNLDMTGATFGSSGTLRMQNTETLTAFTNDTDSGTIEYYGAGAYNDLIAGDNYYSLTFNNAASTWDLADNLDVNGALNIANGTLDLNGHNLDNTGGSFSNTGTLRLQGNETLAAFTNDTDSGTVYYDGAGSYGDLAAGNNYYNLTFDSAGDWDLAADLDVNNNLTLNATVTLDGNGLDLTGATFSNTGLLVLHGDEILTNFVNDTDSGTIRYFSAGSYADLIAGDTYYNVHFYGTGTWDLDADLDVNSELRTAANTTIDLNGHNLDMTGATFNNNGILRLQGSETLTNFTNDTDSGLVSYDSAGSFTGLAAGNNYYDLSFDGGGVWELAADLDVNNSLDIITGRVELDGYNLDLTGATFSNTGTLRMKGDETLTNFVNDTDSGRIRYDGNGVYNGLIAGDAYFLLEFGNGSGVWSLDADLDVNSNLSILSGTLDLDGHNLDLTGATFDNSGTLRMQNTETLTAFTNDTDSGTIEYYGAGAYNDLIAGDNYYSLTFNNAASTWDLADNLDVNGALNIANGTLDLNGHNLDNTGGSFSNTGTLRLQGNETLAAFTNDTDSGAIYYDGAGPLYTGLAAGDNYYNLTFNNAASIWRLDNDLDVNGALNIIAGTLRITGYDLDMSGATFANTGNLRLDGSETLTNFVNDADSGRIIYDGAATYSGLAAGDAYYELLFNNASGTWELDANLDVNGGLQIQVGTLDLNGHNLDMTGAAVLNNTGTLRLQGGETLTAFTNDTDSGTVEYDGAAIYMNMAAGGDYYNVAFNNAAGEWHSDVDVDINNALNIISGTFCIHGHNLDLTGATFSNTGRFEVAGSETLTNFTNDTDSGWVLYGGAGSYSDLIAGDTYYNVRFSIGTWDLDADLDVNNSLQINGAILDLNGHNLDMTGATFSMPDGTLRMQNTETLTAFTNDTDSGTIEYDGAGAYNDLIAGDNYYNLTFNNAAGTWSLDSDLDVNGVLNIASGILDLEGFDLDLTGGSFSNTGVLALHGDETLTNFTNDTNSGLVNYYGGGMYAELAAGDNYYNLTLDGGCFYLDAALDVNGALSIVNAGDLHLSGFDLDLTGGSFSNEGILYLNGAETLTNFTNDTDSGRVHYYGNGAYSELSAGDAYYDLGFSNGGTWDLDADLDVNDLLHISGAGTTLDLNGHNLDMTAATLSNDATLRLQGDETLTAFVNDTDSGTVEYDGTGAYYSLAAGGNYFNLLFNNAASLWRADMDVDINNSLVINSGDFGLAGHNLDMTAATFSNNGNLTLTGAETLTNFTNDLDSGWVGYVGAGSGLNAGNAYYGLMIAGGGVRELAADVTANQLAIYATTFDLNGHNLDITGGGVVINTGTLRLEGGESLTGFTNDTDSGTVEYDGPGDYGLLAAGANYYNLSFNNALGEWDLSANTDINNALTILAGALNLDGNNLDMTGATFSNTGTLKLSGSETLTGFTNDTDSGLIEYWGAGNHAQLAAGDVYYDVSFDSTGTWDLDADLDVNNLLRIDTAVVDLNGHNLDMTGATFNNHGTLRLQGGETLTAFTNDTDSGTVEYDGGAISYSGLAAGDAYYNLTFNNGATHWSLDADLDVNNALTISAGEFDLDGHNLDMTGATFTNNGNFFLVGSETLTNFTNDTNSGWIWYDGPGNFTGLAAGNDYWNIYIDNATTIDLTADLNVNSLLSIQPTGILDLNGHNFDLNGGTLLNEGTLRLQGGETLTAFTNDTNSGVVSYDGAGIYAQLSAGDSYYDLSFDGAGTWSLDAALDVNDDIDINSGTLQAMGHNMNIAGDFSNYSNFTAAGNTVILDGAAQAINGSTTFFNLQKTTAGSITFDNSATQTINGAMNIAGTGPLNLITLQSDSPGDQWEINIPSDTYTIDYLDVYDSNNTGAATIYLPNGLLTNCFNWELGLPIVIDGPPGDPIEPPVDPPIEPPDPPVDPPPPGEEPGEPVVVDPGGYVNTEDISYISYDIENRLKRFYATGKYRTVVIVFEGKVAVAPYDENRIQDEKEKFLLPGQRTSIEGQIRESRFLEKTPRMAGEDMRSGMMNSYLNFLAGRTYNVVK